MNILFRKKKISEKTNFRDLLDENLKKINFKNLSHLIGT